MNTMGDRLKAERDRLGLTIEQLAKRARVGVTTIHDIQSGRIRATTKLTQIARALNVTPNWLESGKEPKTPVPTPEQTYIHASSLEDLAQQLLYNKGPEEIGKLWQLILQESQPKDE